MDITSFVTGNRDRAFLIGDYNSYRSQLSRQLLALRKKLGRTTPKNAKYAEKAPVTAADIGNNHEFVRLILIQAERAWAQAMHMKSTHAEDNATKGLTGSTRRHIISRLNKASGHADDLVTLLRDRASTGATEIDFLEAQAYAQCLAGAEEFEKQSSHRQEDPKSAWKKCLTSFSEAHVIYTALLKSTQKDVYKEVLAGTVDPSIRYAAYQSRLPRTIPISTVAKQYFRRDQPELLGLVENLNPNALEEEKAATVTSMEGISNTASIPTTISWRGRTAPIADAAIGQALVATSLASAQLSTHLSTMTTSSDPSKASTANNQKALAAAYDPVLTAAQDTVDAVRRTLSDLSKEGIPESDPRTQDLRVSDLAANHALISWRVGRNRVLISSQGTRDDGLSFPSSTSSGPKKTKKPTNTPHRRHPVPTHTETTTHKLARLTDRTVLYDSTLQSIDSLRTLRGASRDAAFMAELDAQHAYFHALKCLNIAHSHALLAHHPEALALFARAADLAAVAGPSSSAPTDADDANPPTLAVSARQIQTLQTTLSAHLTRQRGLVTLQKLVADEAAQAQTQTKTPLVARLHAYPGVVDLENVVPYPPRLEAVPVKPIFLDLAWGFVGYPGRGEVEGEEVEEREGAMDGVKGGVVDTGADAGKGGKEEKRRGWFGFGRG